MPQLRLRVVIVEEEGGDYSAFCPELEGCMTQAETLDAVKANIIEAIKLNLEHLAATGQSLPTLPVEHPGSDGLLLPRRPAGADFGTGFAALGRHLGGDRQEFDLLLA